MRQRAWAGGLILGIGLFLLAGRAEALIIRLLPMRDVMGDSTFICAVKVDTLDRDNRTMLLAVDEALKGKPPFQKLPVLLKGDAEAEKGKQTSELLKRLAPKLPLLVFISQRGKEYVAFAYTNGTWFQMHGVKPEDADTVRWSFTHTEPFLRRTFSGSTEEMKKVVADVLAGKRKPPDTNAREKPGLGPEVKPEPKPEKSGLRLHQGPVFGVVVMPLLGGPLAVLAMLFPALFGGWKRWLALIGIICTTSTLYLLHWWFGGFLVGTIWASPLVLWLLLTAVTLLGCSWAWARHVRRIEDGQAPLVPGRVEQVLLLILTLVGVGVLGYAYFKGEKLLTPAWMQILVICLGAAVTAGYVTLVRLRGAAALAPPADLSPSPDAPATGPATGIKAERPQAPLPSVPDSRPLPRRPVVASEVVMLTVMALASTALAGTQQGRSVTVGGGAESSAAGAATLDDFPIRQGKLAWKHEWKERGVMCSAPLVAGNRLYVAVAHNDTFRPQGVVYCFDRKSGELKWSTRDTVKDMRLISLSSPCLADGLLFIGEGFHDDSNCRLHCLDSETGRPHWPKPFETGSHVESSPTVVDGKVYFGAGDDGIYCVEAKTGTVVWHFPGLHVDAGPVVHKGRLYVGSGTGDVVKQPAIVCVDAANGTRVWQHEQQLPVWGSPTLVGDLVYFGLGNGRIGQDDPNPQGEVLAVQADTGTEVWRFKAGNNVLCRPAVDRSRVYFGSSDQHLYCVDRKTGELCWKLFLGSPLVTSVALARGDSCGTTTGLYVLAEEGQVYCVGSKGGRIYWSYNLSKDSSGPFHQLTSSPALAVTADKDGQTRRLYFGATLKSSSDTPVLYCLEDRLEADPADAVVASNP